MTDADRGADLERPHGSKITPSLRHNADVSYAAFSPDGRYAVTASLDHTTCIWDAATGEPIGPPQHHTGRVEHLCFSPDSRQMATATYQDGRVRVWEVATGEPITPFLQHPNSVWHASFSPDGRQVLTACGDGFARLWDLPFDDRPLLDLELLVEVLAGVQRRAPGTFVSLDPTQFHHHWTMLGSKYARDLSSRPTERKLGDPERTQQTELA